MIVTKFISAGINFTKKSLDWNKKTNIIAYCAANRILLYDPLKSTVVGASIETHGNSVNCVEWARNERCDETILLSLACGSVQIWKYEPSKTYPYNSFSILSLLSNIEGDFGILCAGSASICTSIRMPSKDNLFVIATGDNHKITGWEIDMQTGTWEETFNYVLPKRSIALDVIIVPMTKFSKNSCLPLVVYAGDDGKIHILSSADGNNYHHIGSLAGHHDWVMTLDYSFDDNGDILLSSGSKDGIIRIWRFYLNQKDHCSITEELQVKSLELTIPIIQEVHEEISRNFKEASHNTLKIYCSLESVLQGHDGLVTQIDWSPHSEGESLQLLSCSKTEDRSVIIWQYVDDGSDSNKGIWVEKTRLGEVGGNREGFLNAKFGPVREIVAATSYQGGLHIWHLENNTWIPQPVVSGHFNDVVDLDWDVQGRYLLSASKDQTTRLYAPYHSNVDDNKYWQEIARPQVHGFDMASLVCLDKYKFVSGAEEKVIRGFTATSAFVKSFSFITNTEVERDLALCELPETASVPNLGLSNKAEVCQKESEDSSKTDIITTSDNQGLPTEDKLMLGTLWPEVSKLYGHGNEILSLAATHDGKLLASSCRAANEIDAKVIIWDTEGWKEIQSLCENRLSVTQMSFSNCDKYLLCVSRDRSWVVYERVENSFSVKAHSGKLGKKMQHSRIIWSCCWISGTLRFITGSRDKSVVVWKPVRDEASQTISGWEREATSTEGDEVTAVAAASANQTNKFFIAIGTNSGKLILRTYDCDLGKFIDFQEAKISHVQTIRRLKFNPVNISNKVIQLASCGNDNAVIIYDITNENLSFTNEINSSPVV